MKAFVYDKKTSNTIATFSNVSDVSESDNTIYITVDNRSYAFDTKQVKTRIYQN